MRRDKKQQKDIDLPTALLQNMPEELKRARAVLIDKKGALVYVLRDEWGSKTGKLVLAIDFFQAKETANSVRSGGKVEIGSLRDKKQYELLTGKI